MASHQKPNARSSRAVTKERTRKYGPQHGMRTQHNFELSASCRVPQKQELLPSTWKRCNGELARVVRKAIHTFKAHRHCCNRRSFLGGTQRNTHNSEQCHRWLILREQTGWKSSGVTFSVYLFRAGNSLTFTFPFHFSEPLRTLNPEPWTLKP